jgi:ABC-type protease/lipase transport system fused ATPase/permease subunit
MIVAHQPAALAECDKVLLLANGTQQAFGPRAEILGRVTALGRVGQPGPRATNVLSPALAFGEAKP